MVLECCAVRQRKWSNLQQGPTWQAGRLALCRPRVNKPACALFTKGQQPSAVRTAPESPRPPAFTGHCRILRRSNRFRCLTPNNEAKFHGFRGPVPHKHAGTQMLNGLASEERVERGLKGGWGCCFY